MMPKWYTSSTCPPRPRPAPGRRRAHLHHLLNARAFALPPLLGRHVLPLRVPAIRSRSSAVIRAASTRTSVDIWLDRARHRRLLRRPVADLCWLHDRRAFVLVRLRVGLTFAVQPRADADDSTRSPRSRSSPAMVVTMAFRGCRCTSTPSTPPISSARRPAA